MPVAIEIVVSPARTCCNGTCPWGPGIPLGLTVMVRSRLLRVGSCLAGAARLHVGKVDVGGRCRSCRCSRCRGRRRSSMPPFDTGRTRRRRCRRRRSAHPCAGAPMKVAPGLLPGARGGRGGRPEQSGEAVGQRRSRLSRRQCTAAAERDAPALARSGTLPLRWHAAALDRTIMREGRAIYGRTSLSLLVRTSACVRDARTCRDREAAGARAPREAAATVRAAPDRERTPPPSREPKMPGLRRCAGAGAGSCSWWSSVLPPPRRGGGAAARAAALLRPTVPSCIALVIQGRHAFARTVAAGAARSDHKREPSVRGLGSALVRARRATRRGRRPGTWHAGLQIATSREHRPPDRPGNITSAHEPTHVNVKSSLGLHLVERARGRPCIGLSTRTSPRLRLVAALARDATVVDDARSAFARGAQLSPAERTPVHGSRQARGPCRRRPGGWMQPAARCRPRALHAVLPLMVFRLRPSSLPRQSPRGRGAVSAEVLARLARRDASHSGRAAGFSPLPALLRTGSRRRPLRTACPACVASAPLSTAPLQSLSPVALLRPGPGRRADELPAVARCPPCRRLIDPARIDLAAEAAAGCRSRSSRPGAAPHLVDVSVAVVVEAVAHLGLGADARPCT